MDCWLTRACVVAKPSAATAVQEQEQEQHVSRTWQEEEAGGMASSHGTGEMMRLSAASSTCDNN